MNKFSHKEIWKMFDSITPRYDFLNHFLSLGLDFLWRRKLSKNIKIKETTNILDICTGTGDQIFSFLKNRTCDPNTVKGIDMSEKMLEIGKSKSKKKKLDSIVSFKREDALNINSDSSSIDVVTISFGIRNVSDTAKCLNEMYRVLKPCGQVLILEFSIPSLPIIKHLYILHLTYILPLIAGIFTNNKQAYLYLGNTIKLFPCGENFLAYLQRAGFCNIKQEKMCFGAVTLYKGLKQ